MKRLNIPVEEYTTPSPVTVGPEVSVKSVYQLMQDHGIRHLPVVLHGKPIGIISERDIRVVANLAVGNELTARDVMTASPYTAKSTEPLENVVFHMSKSKIGSAIINDDETGEMLGIFTSTDALNALVEVVRGDVEI